MKWSIIGGLLLCSSLFTGCIKEKCTNNLPECIKEIVNNPAKNNDLKTIRLQVQGTEHYYWLNTDATAFDGVEYIINNRCDTVCYFCGECIYPDCLEQFKDKDWEVIWRR